jgi:predicted ester cyclase
MIDINKNIIRRVLEEGGNRHDIAVIRELYPNVVYHAPLVGELRGEAYRRFVASVLDAFPDAHWTIEDQIAEDDRVMTRWSFVGTHKERFMDIAPTGKKVRISGMCIDRIVEGKIVEEWEEFDGLGMMRQLGAVPAHIEEPVAA